CFLCAIGLEDASLKGVLRPMYIYQGLMVDTNVLV
ncbi:hypothetical protein A2U01_0048210, partial [Trifolium medium]|nr:hypothetical protein [Trifolium medium]